MNKIYKLMKYLDVMWKMHGASLHGSLGGLSERMVETFLLPSYWL